MPVNSNYRDVSPLRGSGSINRVLPRARRLALGLALAAAQQLGILFTSVLRQTEPVPTHIDFGSSLRYVSVDVQMHNDRISSFKFTYRFFYRGSGLVKTDAGGREK